MLEFSNSEMTRIMIASGNRTEIMRITELLDKQHFQVVGIAENGIEASRMAVEIAPDVALLDEDLAGMDGVAAAETIWLASPRVSVILLSGSPERILRRAMRAGVKEVIAKPVVGDDLLDALRSIDSLQQKRQTQEYSTLIDPRLMPRVIAVTGAKGGIGKTVLSTNLAVSLAQKFPAEVLLLDLHAQYGDVPLMLDLRPKRTLMDILPSIDDIDEDLLEAHMTEHQSGLKVLITSIAPVDLNLLSAHFLSVVLNCLKRRYRLIVMDVPCLLDDATIYALTSATAVVLIANLSDLTTVHDTSKLYDALRDRSVPIERVHLVLNRLERRNRLQGSAIQQALGQSAWASIPEAYNIVVNAINEGVPFVIKHPGTPISRSVQQLADRLEQGESART